MFITVTLCYYSDFEIRSSLFLVFDHERQQQQLLKMANNYDLRITHFEETKFVLPAFNILTKGGCNFVNL